MPPAIREAIRRCRVVDWWIVVRAFVCGACNRLKLMDGPIFPPCECGATMWASKKIRNSEPTTDYKLSHNDKRFLQSIKIQADE